MLVTPFVLTGSIASGTAMWSNVVAGLLVLVLAAYGAYERRSSAASAVAEWSGWIASLAGLWILVSPFVLTGSIASGDPLSSNVIAGVVAAVLAAYAGYGTE